jgi:hypothetical protein
MIRNIRKSFKRAGIAIQFGDGILWAKVDLSGCKKPAASHLAS